MIRLAVAAVVAATLATAAVAGEDRDEDRARRALESGQIVPFEKVLQRLRSEHPGKILGVELEVKGGRFIYEVRLLAPGGRIEEWRYDASTMEPVAGRRRDHRRNEDDP